jgi:hypothetical protein
MDGTMTSEGMNMSLSASGVEDVAAKQADITMTMPMVGTVEVRMVDGVGYIKVGDGTSPLSTGGKWSKLGDDGPASESLSGSETGFDAKETLGLLKNLSADGVTAKGAATVRGVATTHDTARLDLTKIAAQESASGDDPEDLNSIVKSTGLSTMPVDLYLDAQGRLRRFVMALTMKGGSATAAGDSLPGDGSFSMTMDFFDFGVPVYVTAPPADQIVAEPSGN